ncbi:MAG: hypothetical protein OXL37_17330 [Chloroflexota bacterium]|nr:hypothetical protein [Chloroflexota bacterium]
MNNTIRYDDDAERASIFTVPVRRIRPHFWTFSVFFIATTLFYVYVHAIDAAISSWQDTPSAIMGDVVYAAGFWIIFSPILVEGVAMVFAAIFRQKTRKEGREEGRVEGREEGREEGRKEGQAVGREEADAAWREWNRRREEAIAEGKPFDEPTPDSRNGKTT